MYLYEIESALLSLFDRIDEGEIAADDAADTIEALGMEYEMAIDGAATKIKGLIAEHEAIKAEMERLKARAEKKALQAEKYRNLILASMRMMDKVKVETPRNVVAIRKNPPKVVIDNEASFCAWAMKNAPAYVVCDTKYRPNKDEIRRVIAGGGMIDGARMESGETLNIK
ncbi:MAG: siphovirus Gp157 family protein [Clostridia bacterium]|nr:siphovirus Gp157 family protein [Clostridia bacterium]